VILKHSVLFSGCAETSSFLRMVRNKYEAEDMHPLAAGMTNTDEPASKSSGFDA
jgi:hypothetical protein